MVTLNLKRDIFNIIKKIPGKANLREEDVSDSVIAELCEILQNPPSLNKNLSSLSPSPLPPLPSNPPLPTPPPPPLPSPQDLLKLNGNEKTCKDGRITWTTSTDNTVIDNAKNGLAIEPQKLKRSQAPFMAELSEALKKRANLKPTSDQKPLREAQASTAEHSNVFKECSSNLIAKSPSKIESRKRPNTAMVEDSPVEKRIKLYKKKDKVNSNVQKPSTTNPAKSCSRLLNRG